MPGSVLRVLNKTQREELLLLPHFTDEETEVCREECPLPIPGTYSKSKHKSLMCGHRTPTLGPWGILASERERPRLSANGTSPLQHRKVGTEPVPWLRAPR